MLGGVALEALFGPGAGDDPLPVAPAHLGSELALLLPQLFEPVLDLPDLRLPFGVVSLRQRVPELDATLTELVDLAVDDVDLALDYFKVSHFSLQRRWTTAIPGPQNRNTVRLPRPVFCTTRRGGQGFLR